MGPTAKTVRMDQQVRMGPTAKTARMEPTESTAKMV
jgi:hypothetical protein